MTLETRCSAIEECYEFMLAFAAQGLDTDAGSQSGTQIREFLRRAVTALTGWRTPARWMPPRAKRRPPRNSGPLSRCWIAMPATRWRRLVIFFRLVATRCEG